MSDDRALNRRAFLSRSAAVTAAVTAGAALPALPALGGSAGAAPSAGSRRVRVPNVDVRPEARADPTEATIAEAVTLIRHGLLTSTALTEALLARIAEFESTYLAFNTVLSDAALRTARDQDRRRTGALGGIPLCIKDNYFTRGVPTTANSFIFADFVPPYDATSVARLVAGGGIVLGKGQMGPLATTRATEPNGTITTVNAWTPTDPSVDPGGSSTGPACSVAGRLATSSIGTQTGGSIVLPANQQNLTGLKPTMGRTSIHGVIPLTYTRDHSGPLARDVLDAAIMLQLMAGPDPDDVRTLGLPRVPDLVTSALPVTTSTGRPSIRRHTRVGVPPDYLDAASVPPDVLALRQDFLRTVGRIQGVRVVDVTYPDDWTLLTGSVFNNVRLPERTEEMLPFLQQDPTLFGVSGLSWLQGLFLSGDEWITGQRAKHHLLREVIDGVLARCDVVLQTGPAPFDSIGPARDRPADRFPRRRHEPEGAGGDDRRRGPVRGGPAGRTRRRLPGGDVVAPRTARRPADGQRRRRCGRPPRTAAAVRRGSGASDRVSNAPAPPCTPGCCDPIRSVGSWQRRRRTGGGRT